jgi:hypothetical protein
MDRSRALGSEGRGLAMDAPLGWLAMVKQTAAGPTA